ncbi:translation initiation factor IF-3 [Microcella daejeonensis]|uniref:Translation initiation factor IF-3 n=1 Tax=Microcella daejeonensis TaxID=2994971 RepID=A0A9E8ML65_9MICO|nr:translation initiation factor IF-3 [Microcella daejeonensis]WAB81509.1 translation initiation factor IF-3 [Microcella daejeonensis]
MRRSDEAPSFAQAGFPPTGGCHSHEEEKRISEPRTNDRIRVPEVRLVGPGGEQVGVVKIEVALRLAQEADLDLVEVAPNSKPPVVKVMDYGKFKYEAAQKAKEARRNQANTILKEVRFRLKIDKHDYETKRKRAEGFLQAGDKVKAMILFRGREQSRPEMGVRLLQRFAEEVSEFGAVESTPTIDGRNMVMIIGPHKNKADAKAEQNAARAQAKAARKADESAPSAGADRSEEAAASTAATEAPAEVLPAEFVKAPAAARKAPAAAPAAEAPAETAPAASDAAAADPTTADEKPAAASKPAASKPATSKPAAKSTPKPAVGKPPLKPTPKNAPTPRMPAAPKTPAPTAE